MVVIFDFDRTLFDVNTFKKDLAKIIGVDYEKDYKKTYDRLFVDTGKNKTNYDLGVHLKELGKDDKITKKKIKIFLKISDQYLLPGALDLLDSIKKNGDELFLITFGNIAWQKEKVKSVKRLNKYFDNKHKIFVDKDKIKSLDFLKKQNKKLILINDNKKEGLAMKKFLGKETKLFLVKGDYSESYKGRIYHNLKEIKKELFK
jgi:hypothetical protein